MIGPVRDICVKCRGLILHFVGVICAEFASDPFWHASDLVWKVRFRCGKRNASCARNRFDYYRIDCDEVVRIVFRSLCVTVAAIGVDSRRF